MMKFVVIFTVMLAAWLSCAAARRSCEDINQCSTSMAKIMGMDPNKINEACPSLREVLGCFDEVIENCRKDQPQSFDEQNIKPNMDQLRNLINSHCGNGAGAVTVSLGLLLFALLASFF